MQDDHYLILTDRQLGIIRPGWIFQKWGNVGQDSMFCTYKLPDKWISIGNQYIFWNKSSMYALPKFELAQYNLVYWRTDVLCNKIIFFEIHSFRNALQYNSLFQNSSVQFIIGIVHILLFYHIVNWHEWNGVRKTEYWLLLLQLVWYLYICVLPPSFI